MKPARRFAKEAVRYDAVQVTADQRRQLNLLKVALVLATPSDPKESDELSKIMARLESAYGKGKWCTDASKPDTCRNIDDVSRILSSPGNEKALRAAWEGWHTISPPMRKDYQRFVELSNKGAKELGFADTGAMWRSKYDMPPGRLHEGARSTVGAGTAALREAPRVRAPEAAREVRRRGAGTGPHSRRTCSATCGRRTGRTSTRWSRHRTPIRASR